MLPLPSVSCKWKKGSNFLAKEGIGSQSEASSQPAWSCILNGSLRYPLRNDLPDTKVSSRKLNYIKNRLIICVFTFIELNRGKWHSPKLEPILLGTTLIIKVLKPIIPYIERYSSVGIRGVA